MTETKTTVRDKYGPDFEKIPEGPKQGLPWARLEAWSLRAILNAVRLKYLHLDPRRVAAIARALREKEGQPPAVDRK